METSVISQALNKVNPLYATTLGQPFEGQGIDMSSDRWVLNITVIICSNYIVILGKVLMNTWKTWLVLSKRLMLHIELMCYVDKC